MGEFGNMLLAAAIVAILAAMLLFAFEIIPAIHPL